MLLGLRSLAAIVVGALVLAMVDGIGAGPSSVLFVAGGLALVASPLACLTPLGAGAASTETPSRLKWAPLLVLGGLPLLPVLVGRGGDLSALSAPTLLTLLVLPLVALVLWLRSLRAIAGELTTREWAVCTICCVLAAGLSAWATLAESTLIQVRPGYEFTHLGLFACTWVGAMGSSLALTLGFGMAGSERRWGRARELLGVASVVVGLGLHWADRSFLYDIHLGVHLWARACALGMMVSGTAMLVVRIPWGGRAAALTVVAFVASSIYFVLGSAPATDMVFRARVGQGELGRTLLRLRPLDAQGARVEPDPRLDFARGYDVRAPRPVPNILLITVDTLRADALTKMPQLSAFATRGVRFERVYAPASGTTYSLPAIFAGRNVAELDWELVFSDASGRELTDDEVAARGRGEWLEFSVLAASPPGGGLVSRMRATGRIANAAVDDGLFYFRPPAGRLHRDFDRYDMVPKQPDRRAAAVVDRALQHIDEAGAAPWFEWVHLFDPHDYDVASARDASARYLEQVDVVDRELARMFDELASRGRLDDTAILVTADHGEAFGEHGHRGHRSSLYEEQVRVPLILVAPGLAARQDDVQLVSAIDVAPTLAALAGADMEGFSGLNLLSVGEGTPVERPVFMAQLWYARESKRRRRDAKALVWGHYKLIWRRSTESLELYDLNADPEELDSLLLHEHAPVEDLQALLRDYVYQAESAHPLP